MGLLGKSFKSLNEARKNNGWRGDGGVWRTLFSRQGKQILTQAHIDTIDEYNDAVDNGELTPEKLEEITKDLTVAQKEYFTNLKGGKATQEGYAEAQGLATKSTKALTAVTTIMNSVITAGISWLISQGINALINFAHASEKTAENAEAFASTLSKSNTEFAKNKKTISDLSKEYSSLSQHVTKNGENIDLSNEQYDRYKEIISQVSDLMPELTTYFNAQGEKIGFATDKLLDLNKAYDEYQEKAANDFISRGSDGNTLRDIVNNYNNKSGENWVESTWEGIKAMFGQGKVSDAPSELARDLINEMLGTKNKQQLYDLISNSALEGGASKDASWKRTLLDNLGIVKEYVHGIFSIEDMPEKELRDKLNAALSSMESDISTKTEQIREAIRMTLRATGSGFSELAEEEQNVVMGMISNLGNDVIKEFGIKSEADIIKIRNRIINAVKSNPQEIEEAWKFLMSPDESLTGNDYRQRIEDAISKILTALKLDDNAENRAKIRISFGIEDNLTQQQIAAIQNKLAKLGIKGAQNFDGKLTEKQIRFVLTTDWGDQKFDGYDNLKEYIDNYQQTADVNNRLSTSTQKLESNIKSIAKSFEDYKLISGAVNETHLLTDQEMAKLITDFPDLEKKLTYTTQGWKLESSAMDIVNGSVVNLTQAYAASQAALTDSATIATMQRLGLQQAELNNMNSMIDGIQWLQANNYLGFELHFTTTGDLDISKLSMDAQAVMNMVRANIMRQRAVEALNKSRKLGVDDTEDKERKAQEARDKKIREAEESIAKKRRDLQEKQYNADFENRLNVITQAFDNQAEAIERLKTAYDGFAANDYVSRIGNLEQTYAAQAQYSADLKTQMDDLLAITPQTSDAWDKLASKLEDISQKYFESQRAVIEYRNSIQEAYIESQGYLADMASNSADKANMSSQIRDILENGSFTRSIFDFDEIAIMPRSLVDKQKAENRQLEAEQKRYQDAINEIRKKATDEAKAYDDEQRKIEREEAERDYQEALSDAQATYDEAVQNAAASAFETIEGLNDAWVNDTKITMEEIMAWIRDNKPEWGAKLHFYDVNGNEIDLNGNIVKSASSTAPNPTSQQFGYYRGSTFEAFDTHKRAHGGDTSGLTLVNDGIGKYAGTEGYIGADGKLHWLKDGGQLFGTNDNVHIINAEDMREIIKHTGDRYFNEPIGDLASVTKYASGNTSVSFNSTGNERLDAIATSINSQFNNLKSTINVEPVKMAIYNGLTDKAYYNKLAVAVGTETGKAIDNQNVTSSIYEKILENSSWDDLTDDVREKFSELGATKDNWDEFTADNKLQAVELMQDGSVNSWDLLSPTMQTIITDSGLASSETWTEYVNSNPLEALILLTSSWDNMKAQILQYMSDSTQIAQDGANAIHAIQIEAPYISQASWDALQTLIANKIQEILTVINETFGNNTIDLNFNVGLNGSPQTNPQGTASGNAIVSTARNGLGTPYVWGGTSANGWDCSGFLINVMAQNGVTIPERTTQAQWASNTGQRITDKSQLQPGDAMYFADSSGDVHHVGIYAGNGKMIHAANSRLGTIETDFDNSQYYQSQFIGAKRYYATGTKDYGIAGENYKLEWAINKQNGKWSPITEPTLFDKSKYDIVGEKVSERLDSEIPVFAKGTISFASAIATLFGAKTNTPATQEKETEGKFPKYNLTPDEAEEIARVITGETGGANKESVYAEASQMVNLHEVAYGRDNSTSLLRSVRRASQGGWYADASWGRGVTDLARQAVQDVIVHGFRTLPRYVYEHDTFPMDIIGALPRSSYVQGVTPVRNRYGSSGIFWAFPDPNGDIFFYTSQANRQKYGDFCYDVNQVPGTGAFGGNSFAQKLNEIYDKLKTNGVLGQFITNTHTTNPTVAQYRPLGLNRQSAYGFDAKFTTHANGTKDYHIAGENHRPEIAVDKKTRQLSIIDSPTLFDPNAMDIVGEDTTARLLAHAGGTLTDEQKKHLETINAVLPDGQKYSETDIPWDLSELEIVAKAISNIDKDILKEQENGLATRKLVESYAKLNIITKEIEDDTLKEKMTELTQAYNRDRETLASESQSAGAQIGEEYQGILAGLASGETTLGSLFDVTQKAYQQASEYQGKAALLDIQYQKDQIAPLKSVAENLRKFRDEQADNPDLWNKANDKLEDVNDKIKDIDEKVAGVYEAEAARMESDINQIRLEIGGAFKEGISYLAKDSEAIQRQLNRAGDIKDDAERVRVTNQSYDALIANYREQIDRYTQQQQQAHDYANGIRNNPIYAELFQNYPMEELFDAAGEFNDKYYEILAELNMSGNEDKVAEFKTVAEGLQGSKKLWLEASDAITQLSDNTYDATKAQNDFNEQIKLDKIDKYIKLQNRISEILDYQKTLNDRIVAATEARNALAKEFRDTIAEAEKELRTSKHLEEWLDPDTRAQLFNENDYNAEISEVRRIQAESEKLYRDYQKQISGLHEEDAYQAEAITAEYEKQREALEEQLGIAKQQLDIAKKRSAYENAQRERDTQIIMGGRNVNVHDPEDLYNKAQELADAEIDLANTQTTNAENATVRDMERFSDQLAAKIAEIANRTDMISIMDEEDKKIFSDFIGSIDDINIMLETLTKSNPWFLTSTDNTHELYGDIDTEMASHGYRLTWDYEAHIENLYALLEQGIISTEHFNNALNMLMQDHDYKGSTDTYQSIMRNGYPLHKPNASQLKGLHEMRVYDDANIATKRLPSSNYDYNNDPADAKILPNGVTVSGGAQLVVGTNNLPKISSTGVIEIDGVKYVPTKIASLPAMLPEYNLPTFAAGTVLTQNSIPDSAFKSIGSQDNSTNYSIAGDIVITNPVGSADDLLREITQKTNGMYGVTNNMR